MARDKEGAVALHYAAKSGDPKVTQIHHVRCIPAAVTVEDNEGRTPLHYAGMAKGTGADEVFSLLEKEGASADAADMESIEELHKAVEEGETRKVVQLLDKRKKAQTRDRNQANILHKAVLHGHTDLVRYMVSSFPELMKQEDRAGRTPLHYAAVIRDGGHIYKILEKEGADSKAKDQSGHSPEDYKNDPKILTQWDLKNELEEGIGHDGGGGRPLTKGSEGDEDDAAAQVDPATLILLGEENEAAEEVDPAEPSNPEEENEAAEEVDPAEPSNPEEENEAAEEVDPAEPSNPEEENEAPEPEDPAEPSNPEEENEAAEEVDPAEPSNPEEENEAAEQEDPAEPDNPEEENEAAEEVDPAEPSNPEEENEAAEEVDPAEPSNPEEENEVAEQEDPAEPDNPEEENEAAEEVDPAEPSNPEEENEAAEQADPAEPSNLQEEYEKFKDVESNSLLKKYLTQEVFDSIKDRVTSKGATLLDCIKSGLANPDSHIGLYAPDAESYAEFRELFDPVIDEYHGGFGPEDTHPVANFGDPSDLGDLNELGDYVLSTRVRCARSIEGFPFNPLLTSDQYTELEQNVGDTLATLEDDLAGNYRSLKDISPEEQEDLLEKHLLFKQGDRFLEAAGASRFWPEGRGIFLNENNTLVVWVNEEDHMRIISMQEGGNIGEVYERFVRAVTALGERLPFSSSEHLGFLSFCPTNLGTAIRASVHIRLPLLGEDRQTLEETAAKFNLQVRGTSGEHSEAKDYVFDISNRRRLGITEIEALQEMYDGVMEIIRLERSLEENGSESLSNESKEDPNKLSDRHQGKLSRRNSSMSTKSEFPGMWSDEGQYLTSVLGDALVKALSEVNEARPKDPISYLACSLYSYRYSDKPESPADGTNDSKSLDSTGSGGSGHSTIAMQTVLDNTGGPQQTSPQTRDKNGQNVLHFAASRPHGRSAFYRLVAESGCNLADRDDKYRTPRDVAEENDLQENVRAIDKWVINLASEGKQKQLKKLLIDGYDHIADIDDDQGNNILEVAQNKGQNKTVDFLRGLNAFEEKRDWLHKAIRVGSLPHVQYIADTEDIARAKDTRSRTSLHIATLCEEKEIMEFLAAQYPDLLKIGDNLERTPLHYAMAVEGVDQVAKVLVQAGARRAVKDLRGKQPSYYFMNRGEVVEMIEELRQEEE
ncbi:uncharacterized protein [Palaemon carinicauda]|uniref:uncharacterized protein isoform X1 n=1 Tax=Palaemon carinicauda TaxID=392227 RepID=UPI0035B5C371